MELEWAIIEICSVDTRDSWYPCNYVFGLTGLLTPHPFRIPKENELSLQIRDFMRQGSYL